MQRKSTIQSEGKWFKGNTHAHTNRSDGTLSPPELVSLYKKQGYDFTAITDHRIYGDFPRLSDSSFLVWPGIELDVPLRDSIGFCHHVVGLGIPGQNRFMHDQKINYKDDATVQDLVQILQGNGNLCIYAHPAWSHALEEELPDFDGLTGMEIYNHTCEVSAGCGYSDSYYNRLLWQKRKIWCLASDDTHQHEQDYYGGFIMVKAASLSQESLYHSLMAGSFYASQGPLIEDFYIEDGQATLICSPCRSISFQTDSFPGYARVSQTFGLTNLTYPLRGDESYLRAVCTDQEGRQAWTQPIWF